VIRHIHILNASRLDDRDLLLAAEAAGREYGAPAGVERISLGFDRAFDPSRGQYRSGILLAEVLSGSSSPDEKRIAVVDVDLFVPVLTFVFGEAQLEGLAAIVSTHRLSDEFYGLKGDRRRLLERLEKEVVHELGHGGACSLPSVRMRDAILDLCRGDRPQEGVPLQRVQGESS
jgi:hypothetical protein